MSLEVAKCVQVNIFFYFNLSPSNWPQFVNATTPDPVSGIGHQATTTSILSDEFENHTFEIIATSPRGQWVNSLRPRDAIWRRISGSTLAHVMAWCLMAPSHYLNQSWLIVSKVLYSCGIHLGAISSEIPEPPFIKIGLKITNLNLNLPGANQLIHQFLTFFLECL